MKPPVVIDLAALRARADQEDAQERRAYPGSHLPRAMADRRALLDLFSTVVDVLEMAGIQPGTHANGLPDIAAGVLELLTQRNHATTKLREGARALDGTRTRLSILRRRMADYTDGPIAEEMQLLLAEDDVWRPGDAWTRSEVPVTRATFEAAVASLEHRPVRQLDEDDGGLDADGETGGAR